MRTLQHPGTLAFGASAMLVRRMPDAPRLFLAATLAITLAGCTTPQVTPKLSQAVIDARAHLNAPAAPACPSTPLGELSPVLVGFAFGESTLDAAGTRPLVARSQWLACHPATLAVIKPDADGHGAAAEQNALARRRAEAVAAYLTAHGVAATRIRILARDGAEPAGEHMLLRAEGQRW